MDYSNSSDTDDDEIPLRIKKEAEDVEAEVPPVDEESKVGLVGQDETVPGPDAGIAIGISEGSKESDAASKSDIVGIDEKRSPRGVDAGEGHCILSNPVTEAEEFVFKENDSNDNVNVIDAEDSIQIQGYTEATIGSNADEPDAIIASVVEIMDGFKDCSITCKEEDIIDINDKCKCHKDDEEDDGIPHKETIDRNVPVDAVDDERTSPVNVDGVAAGVLDIEVTDSSITEKQKDSPNKVIDHNDNLQQNPSKIPASPVDIEKIVQICETKYPVIYKPDKKSRWRRGCIVETKDDDKVDIRDLETEVVHIDIPKKYVKPGEKNLEILNGLDGSYTPPSVEKKMKYSTSPVVKMKFPSDREKGNKLRRKGKNFEDNPESEVGSFTKLRKRPTPEESLGNFSSNIPSRGGHQRNSRYNRNTKNAPKQSTSSEMGKEESSSSKTEESEKDVDIAAGYQSGKTSESGSGGTTEEIKPASSLDPDVLNTSHQFSDAEDNDEEEPSKNTHNSVTIITEKTMLPTIFEEGSTVESSLDGDGSVSCQNPVSIEQLKEVSFQPKTCSSPSLEHSFSAESHVTVTEQPASILNELLQCFEVQSGEGNNNVEDDPGREFCRCIIATNSSDVSDNEISSILKVLKEDNERMQMLVSGAMENFAALSTHKLGNKVNCQNNQVLEPVCLYRIIPPSQVLMYLLSAGEEDVKSQLSGCIQSKGVLYSALGTGAGAHLAFRCIPYLGPQEMEQVVQNLQGGLHLADIPHQYISFTEQLIRYVVFPKPLNIISVFKTYIVLSAKQTCKS